MYSIRKMYALRYTEEVIETELKTLLFLNKKNANKQFYEIINIRFSKCLRTYILIRETGYTTKYYNYARKTKILY